MRFFRQLYYTAISGFHWGRGHKAFRQKRYQEALNRYAHALSLDKETGLTPNPASYEFHAQALAAVGRIEEAISDIEMARDLYRQLDIADPVVAGSLIRIEQHLQHYRTMQLTGPSSGSI